MRTSNEPDEPLTEVTLPRLRPGMVDALRPVLEAHGASIEEHVNRCVVHFPAGTRMRRKWPVVLTTRFDVRLPDGFEVLYEVGRDGSTNLCFDPRDFPPEVVERFT